MREVPGEFAVALGIVGVWVAFMLGAMAGARTSRDNYLAKCAEQQPLYVCARNARALYGDE